ncbi:MAG: CpaD family pilus assembly lipoprotein [Alphaproteobacteria bacterium]
MKNRLATSRLLLALGFIGSLAACAPSLQNSQWTEAESPKENKVLFLRETHDVRFDPGKDKLSAAELKGLDAFLAREEANPNDDITIAVARAPDGNGSALSARRQAAVAAYLGGLHLKAIPDGETSTPADQVTVVIGRYVVTPPQCPDWSKPSDDDPSNTPSSNLGCATETNLGLMIADPRDLVSGKPLAGSDAEYTTNAIQRYRQGTYKMPHDAYEQKPDNFAPGTGVTDQSSGQSGQSGSTGK